MNTGNALRVRDAIVDHTSDPLKSYKVRIQARDIEFEDDKIVHTSKFHVIYFVYPDLVGKELGLTAEEVRDAYGECPQKGLMPSIRIAFHEDVVHV